MISNRQLKIFENGFFLEYSSNQGKEDAKQVTAGLEYLKG
jgi:hypothetical protein